MSRLRHHADLVATRGRKLVGTLRHPSLWSAARAGVAASFEHEKVPFARPGTVIDVGASHGQFALLASVRFPEARIISFEPQPGSQIRQVLGDRVDVRAKAVGAELGTATLNVSAAEDSSSLLPIGEGQIQTFPGTERRSTIEVPVTTLAAELADDLPQPWLIKMDIQGFELEALRGAAPILNSVSEVYVECSFVELYDGQALADEVIAFLLEHGLRLVGVYNIAGTASRPIQADLLFRRAAQP